MTGSVGPWALGRAAAINTASTEVLAPAQTLARQTLYDVTTLLRLTVPLHATDRGVKVVVMP
jgi:hypothetical protein